MSEVKFSSWSVAESPIAIEYSMVVIEEIRHAVAEGFQRLSRGGIEVGGVLYGTREGRTIRILAMRPSSCEHARGPAFLLSDKDRKLLNEQLVADQEDPHLEGLTSVGWFLSHTRSEITLTDSDLELYSIFFPAPWQVTLVVRPGRGGSMRAGFFVREADGTVRVERSYLDFDFPDRLAGVLDRPPRSDRSLVEKRFTGLPRSEELPPSDPHADNDGAPAAPIRRATALPPVQVPQFLPSPPPRKKWPWLLLWAAVLIGGAVYGLRYWLLRPPVEPIGLGVIERDGQLQIEWSHSSRSVTAATRGTLEISDGPTARTVALTPQDLERSKFTYVRNSGDVKVRMSVQGADGNKIEEASQFLGRPPAKVDTEELNTLKQRRDELEEEVKRLQRLNRSQIDKIQQLERTLRILQARQDGK